MRDGWNTAVALILYFIFASSSHVGPVAIPRQARDVTRSGEPPCWNRLVVASAAEVTIRTLSSGLVAYFLGGSITDRPARLGVKRVLLIAFIVSAVVLLAHKS